MSNTQIINSKLVLQYEQVEFIYELKVWSLHQWTNSWCCSFSE